MGHDHSHEHHDGAAELPQVLDPAVPDEALSPAEQTRRSFLRRAGLVGAGAAAFSVLGTTGEAGGLRDTTPATVAGRGARPSQVDGR